MAVTRSYKYLEQVVFSLMPFMTVLLSGWLMEEGEFFKFAYLFSILQGALVILYSFETNPVLVFQPRHEDSLSEFLGYKLLSTFGISIIVYGLIFPIIVSKLDSHNPILLTSLIWLCTLCWAIFDLSRKSMFAAGQFSKMLGYSLLAFVLHLSVMLTLWYKSILLTSNTFFGLCLTFAFVSSVYLGSGLTKPKFTSRFSYFFKENYSFAKWSVLAAFGIWLMGQGLLLVAEPWLSKTQFNGLRIILTFLGLCNIFTTVIENKLIIQFGQKEVTYNNVFNQVVIVTFISLLLVVITGIALLLAFNLFFYNYIEVLSKGFFILVSVFFYSMVKPFTAYLKVQLATKLIFYSIIIALIAALCSLSLAWIFDPFYAIIAAFVIGPAFLFLSSIYFVKQLFNLAGE